MVSGLANHTVWSPTNLASVTKPMPIVVLGNGACSGESTFFGFDVGRWPRPNTDYAQVPAKIPSVLGSYRNVGHMGLWNDAALAKNIAVIARNWLNAVHYGDATAKAQFVGANCGLCNGTGWVIKSKNW